MEHQTLRTFPPGTITNALVGSDRGKYYVVRLDNPVRSQRATTKTDWILRELVIANRHTGQLIDYLWSGADSIIIGIANLLVPIGLDEPLLDFSKVEYFGIGVARKG
jgi:hypothetical protein